MALLRPYALFTLAELKAFKAVAGTVLDDEIERYANRAAQLIEGELDRRIVYRAAPEVEGEANIVAARAIANESLPGAGAIVQPNAAGRTLIVTFTDADRSCTAAVVTVTGTVDGVAGKTEVFDKTLGDVIHGVKFFTAISTIVVTGATGAGAGDTYRVGSSVGYEELHTLDRYTSELRSIEWPTRNVLEVNEDSSRAYGASTRLVAATDYELTKSTGLFRRVSGKYPTAWAGGFRAVKKVDSAGYFGTANVPAKLKRVGMELAALLYEGINKRPLGVSGYSDTTGNFTRFGPVTLTPALKAELGEYVRPDLFYRTGERDWDLEAA